MSDGPWNEPPGSGFHRLLARLDRDPARAAQEFERLRRTLTRFFDWRGVSFPDDCADETLDRLAAKLADDVAVLDLAGFAHGIARMVLMESTRARAREAPLDDATLPAPPSPEPADDALARSLEDCLGRLSGTERELVLSYYAGGDGRGKIERRREMARGSGLSDNALRSRVQRLRDRIEACVRATQIGRPRHLRVKP